MNTRLVTERVERGRSVPQFAEDIGVSYKVLRSAEQGGTPSPENALKIARHLGVRVTDLWPVEEEAA